MSKAERAVADRNSRNRKKKRKKRRRGMPVWLTVIITILLVLILAFTAVAVTVNSMLNKIQKVDLTEPAASNEYYTEEELREIDLAEAIAENADNEVDVVYPELNPEDIEWTRPAEQIASGENNFNLLLIGQDARSGETRARSDSMILVSFNMREKTITMTSFLRDLYVQIPGHSDNRLNAAYAFGGMALLDETLEYNFGVTVDANIEVRFENFAKIIDMLGGVDVELSAAEAKYLGLKSAGMTHMNGELALSYSRIRYIDSDFARTGRQRKVLNNLYDNFKNTSLTNAISILNQLFPLLTTDMTNSQIISAATSLMPMLSESNLQSLQIPADGTWNYNTISGMAVIVANFERNREILAETLE